MADDKEPMQADGSDGPGAALANESDPPSAGRPDMQDNCGESEGGAYPNPHTGEDEREFRGGQADAAYFGKGQLGEDEVGKTDNAVSEEE